MKSEIRLQYVTQKDTTTPEFGREFLEVLVKRHPQLAPEIFDTKPERECIDPFVNIEEALGKWAWRGVIKEFSRNVAIREISFVGRNYIKRNSRVKYNAAIGHLDFDKYNNPTFGTFSFWMKMDKKMNWVSVFRDLTQVIEPVLGRMHIFTDAEIKGFPFGSSQFRFSAGPHQPEMRDGLTNLGWANVFSEEYAAEVDEDRLRAQGFAVETVPGGKLFTVTDNLFDVVNDFAKF